MIDNYPEGQVEMLEAVNNPEDPAAGTRQLPFSRTLYIEQDDFREEPPKKFFRLAAGTEVRLRYAYIIKCVGVTKDPASGAITELHCTYDPQNEERHAAGRSQGEGDDSLGLGAQSMTRRCGCTIICFRQPDPDELPAGQTYLVNLNPNSLEVLADAQLRAEPGRGQAGGAVSI